MKVTIVYSNPDNRPGLKAIADAAESYYASVDQLVQRFNLADKNLKYCTGCWSCWWKTPGECAIEDGIADIYKAAMKSDLILYISVMDMGTVTSEMKRLIERMIPLIHPYSTFIDGEIHHRKRYTGYPDTAAILGEEDDTDEGDREINRGYFDRLVKNFHSRLRFVEFSGNLNREAVNELLAH